MISAKPVHKSANLTCSVCGKVCKRLWSLSYHKRAKHGLSVGLEVFPDTQVFPDAQAFPDAFQQVFPDVEVLPDRQVVVTVQHSVPAQPLSTEDSLPDTTQAYQSSDSESEISEGSDRSASQDDLYIQR